MTPMKDRIDPLIQERAPWLFRNRPGRAAMRSALHRVLGYDRTIALGKAMDPLSGPEIMAHMGRMLARNVEVRGAVNIPRDGAALIVANHPTGIADGIILQNILAEVRSDAYFFANQDILKVLPQLGHMIVPVEWRREKRSHGKTRETMALTRRAVADKRLGVIFPSGRLAKRRRWHLHERPWMASAAMIARKFDLPVIPVHLRARNSLLFYLFDALHPTLRDITLFHETLNKDRQPYEVTIGTAIDPAHLPARSDEGIEMLRAATLALGERPTPLISSRDLKRRVALRKPAPARP